MYLRAHSRKKSGCTYEYWSLVESVRTARGPRQKTVATLGKLPGLDKQERWGWEHISELLVGKEHQKQLFETEETTPEWATVDISRVSVERLRSFGSVYLGLALWRRLRLDEFFNKVMDQGREKIPWSIMSCILCLARFCAPSSELQIADFWYHKTALDDILGVPPDKINDDRLYRALDELLPHKDKLFKHFQERYGKLFGTTYDLLLYDITSTYFEGQVAGNSQARRGYSRDNRPDCLQVCIGLVVTPEGLPLAYEVFDGNRADVTTVEEIVEYMRKKYGHERRTWVMDRGMVSEDNLADLRECGASYLVGTPKSQLKKYEKELIKDDWTKMEAGVEVKLCQSPDDTQETYVLCRSPGRQGKEKAIRRRHIDSLERELERLRVRMAAEKRALRDRGKAERRIGALLQRHSRAAHLYEITVEQADDQNHASGKRLHLHIHKHKQRREWVNMADGAYLLRTNLLGYTAKELWRIYIGLTEVEDCFRISKHDLGLRPVFHHKKDRTQAHILVCFLALVMWRTLQQWMKASGIGSAPRKLLEQINEIRSMDVVLPIKDKTDLRLRIVSKPENHLAILLQRLGLKLPNKPKQIGNVVQKIAAHPPIS